VLVRVPREIDLGEGIKAYPYRYWPDRRFKANRGKPHIEWAGCRLVFPSGTQGAVLFDLPGLADSFPKQPRWELKSLDPLHIEPSVQCYRYDEKTKQLVAAEHGFIRGGRWQWAGQRTSN
jgi:hypothetical protein